MPWPRRGQALRGLQQRVDEGPGQVAAQLALGDVVPLGEQSRRSAGGAIAFEASDRPPRPGTPFGLGTDGRLPRRCAITPPHPWALCSGAGRDHPHGAGRATSGGASPVRSGAAQAWGDRSAQAVFRWPRPRSRANLTKAPAITGACSETGQASPRRVHHAETESDDDMSTPRYTVPGITLDHAREIVDRMEKGGSR